MATTLRQTDWGPYSITVRVSGWPSGTGFIRFYIGTDTSDMPYDGYEDVSGKTSCTYTFEGLEPDMVYYVKISPRAATSGQEAMEDPTTKMMTTDPVELERPDDWKWTSTVSKGAEMDFDVISAKEYEVYPLTAREWNRFIDRIFEFLAYLEMPVSGGDESTFYVTAGTEMRAEEVEWARQLISAMDPPVALPASIRAGGKITAAYINGLKNSLNSIE